jgi:hypothetical protein
VTGNVTSEGLDTGTAPVGALTSPAGPAPMPWRACVMVCVKCAGKRSDGLLPDGRTEVRAWLRQRLANAGASQTVRITETSCLGVCPSGGGVTALVVPAHGSSCTDAWVLFGLAEREALLRAALAST